VSQSVFDLAPAVHVLHPGDVACGDRGDRLETLLGSCVAIVLTDPRRTVGAMCHIVHARPASSRERDSTAHAATAMRRLQALLRARGIEPRLCEAFVYGGGNMFPGTAQPGHVGSQNADWALEALAELGVPVLAQDLGSDRYRRISWTIGPGLPRVTAVAV
jgi:chemotaxis protein CheD